MSAEQTKSGHRILVIDDEPEICGMIQRYLEREGFIVQTGRDGADMRRLLAAGAIDLIILDLRLPEEDGLTLLRELRHASTVPVIMLTVKSELIDRVLGLESGADDYLPKPFHPRELLARVRAVLRRVRMTPEARGADAASTFVFEGFRLKPASRELLAPAGEEISLTAAEFDLLFALVQQPNRVLSRDYLIYITRDRHAAPFDRTIDVQIGRLRKKLGNHTQRADIIKTIRNAGYLFTPSVTLIGHR